MSGLSDPPGTVPPVDRDHDTAMEDLHTWDLLDALALGVLSLTGWALIQVEAIAMRILTRHL